MTAPCGSVTTVTPGLWYGRHVAVLSTCGGTMPEPKSERTKKLFNTRSSSWREAGLARQLSRRAVKRARIQAIVTVPLLAGILIVYGYRDDLFGHAYETPVQIVTAIVL